MKHKASFIAIVGLPNAGKSTFLNAILGMPLMATNAKAQTTRRRTKGILNKPDFQLVFSDTPGILANPAYKLQEHMNSNVTESLDDADAVVYIVDAKRGKLEPFLLEKIKQIDLPMAVVVNKIDLCEQDEVELLLKTIERELPKARMFASSALREFNIDPVVEYLVESAPEHPPFFEKDQVSDANIRFFVSEIIRNHALQQFSKEIPYSMEVVVEDYQEEETIHKIKATVYIERESQKAIVIGKAGRALRFLGTRSRREIERLVSCKVFLALTVKVKEQWRTDDLWLTRFGYKKQ